jgi:hypothetical protein
VKNVNVFMKNIDEVMGSSKFPTKTNNGFKDDNS